MEKKLNKLFGQPNNTVVTIHMFLFKFIIVKLKFNSSITIGTFLVNISHLWLVATVLDNADKHFYYHRNFYHTAMISLVSLLNDALRPMNLCRTVSKDMTVLLCPRLRVQSVRLQEKINKVPSE